MSTHWLHLGSAGRKAWIRRPSSSWYTPDLNGYVTGDNLVFAGSNCACQGPCALGDTYIIGQLMWRCPISGDFPNGAVNGDGVMTVGCGDSAQAGSRFQLHRVCSP